MCWPRAAMSSRPSAVDVLVTLTDIAARGPDDPQSWFLFAEASRVMYADRDAWGEVYQNDE